MYKIKVVLVSNIKGDSDNDLLLETIKQSIETGEEFSGATMIMNDWKTESEIKLTLPTFDATDVSVQKVQVYEEGEHKYVTYVTQKKVEDEVVYEQIQVNNIPNDFVKKLTQKTLYDLELTFVQDREPWILAKTQNGKILNGAYFKFANPGFSQLGESVVEIKFNDEGKQIFCDITNENIGKQMAIFIGGKKLTDPVIRAKICGGTAQISGGYTPESAKELSDNLNDGALPAPLILLHEEKISPLLGDTALNNALLAGVVGIVAIFVFMFTLYGMRKAVVTLGVLIMFLLVLGFFMKLVDYALSLSGIAAVILSVGMAVDANILIFERMREEIKKEKNIDAAIDISYERSRFAIKDGNISTGIIAFLLFAMGNSIFKGFGSMLVVTVLLTLFVNVPLTKMLLKIVYSRKIHKSKQKLKNKIDK